MTEYNGKVDPSKIRKYRQNMPPAYKPKYSEEKTTDKVESVKTTDKVESTKTTDKVESTKTTDKVESMKTTDKAESMKRTLPVVNEDYEKGELGSSSTSSSGSDEDSDDSGDDKKESAAKEDIKKDTSKFKRLTPSNPQFINKSNIQPKELVTPVKPVSLSASQEEFKKLENEVKRLKEQLTENETQRLNQKKQYQSKISNLMAYNDQLLTITKQLTGVVENSTTKLTSDQSKEKELLLQIQQVRTELSSKQEEVHRIQEMKKMLMKSMDMYKQKFEERDYNTYQQTNQLLWGQIILWIFVVVIFVIVFSLFIKQTSKLEV